MFRLDTQQYILIDNTNNNNSYKQYLSQSTYQDGHPTGERPLHDLQRLWGWKYEQAGIRLLLEWVDKEGYFSSN